MICAGFSGHFDLTAVNAKTGVVRERRSFDNMILNVGLDGFFNQKFSTPQPALGVGTSTPLPTDTGLASPVFVASSSGTYIYPQERSVAATAPDWIFSKIWTWRVPANVAVGTFSEVGVKGWERDTPYWCRALILDEYGRQSTITVLPDEYLDVQYTLRLHSDLTDRNFSFEMSGVTYNCVARRAYAAQTFLSNLYGSTGRIYSMSGSGRGGMWATQTLGDITSGPSGTGVNSVLETSVAVQPYETSSYSRKTLLSWGLDKANVSGGIGSLIIDEGNPRIPTQISFSPKIPKDATNTLSLMFKVSVRRWGE